MELPVEQVLAEKDIGYKLIRLSESAYTVADVMKFAAGEVRPEEVCKTIILRGRKSGKLVAVLLRGGDKLNFSALKKFFGEEMAIASPEEVKEASGVEPGAVCPALLNTELVVDRRVRELETINCGSGHHLFGLEFKLADLAKLVEYKVADLAKNSTASNTPAGDHHVLS